MNEFTCGADFKRLSMPACKWPSRWLAGLTLLIAVTSASAAMRQSAHYDIISETVNSFGAASGATDKYASLLAEGPIAGLSFVPNARVVVESGYVPQLIDFPLITLAMADLAVSVVDSVDPVMMDGQLTYTTTVLNKGASPATQVTVLALMDTNQFTGQVPTVGAYTSQGTFHQDPYRIVWQIGTLASGAGATGTITVVFTGAGLLNTTTTVTAAETDPFPDNNTAIQPTTVIDPSKGPVIIRPPSDQSVAAGSTATFNVSAGGLAPLQYQWLKNTGALLGETNSSLVITDCQLSDAGDYAVRVSNSAGSVTSGTARLEIRGLLARFESWRMLSPTQLSLSISGPAGAECVVETSTDLVKWTTVSTSTMAAAPIEFIATIDWATPARFFRVRVIP